MTCKDNTPQDKCSKHRRRTVLIPELASPKTDAEALILEMLLLRTLTQDDYLKKGFFIPVHRDHFKREVGNQYHDAIKALVASGAIEVNPRYSSGNFPKSYQLSEELRSCEVREYQLKRSRTSDGGEKVLKHLSGNVAKQLFLSLLGIRCPSDSESQSKWDRVRFNFINRGRYHASRCKQGRFHSNFTPISKAGRRLLTSANGNPLFEVDVSCCQLLLLGAKFRKTSPLAGLMVEPEYIQLCEAGQLYDCILNDLRISCPDLDTDRDFVKDKLIKFIFQKNYEFTYQKGKGNIRNPVGPVFKRLFPNLYQCIELAKADDHTTLAHDLQKLESTIMIDRVCANLLKRSPDASLVTVHDSILCEESLQHEVLEEIKSQFKAMCGVSPHIKVQH